MTRGLLHRMLFNGANLDIGSLDMVHLELERYARCQPPPSALKSEISALR